MEPVPVTETSSDLVHDAGEDIYCMGSRHKNFPCTRRIDICPETHWIPCANHPMWQINVICSISESHYYWYYLCQECCDLGGIMYVTFTKACRKCHAELCGNVPHSSQSSDNNPQCLNQTVVIEQL